MSFRTFRTIGFTSLTQRPTMTPRLSVARATSYASQNHRCFYCGVRMWLKSPDELSSDCLIPKGVLASIRCTAEHLKARQDGGKDGLTNIVAACLTCNRRRHARKKAPAPSAYRIMICKRLAKGKWHDPRLFRWGLISLPAREICR